MSADLDLLARRLRNQQLSRPAFADPAEIVRWSVAVQAQDYAGGKWAIALRSRTALTDRAIERAIAARTIVRTWPMRSTLHFVAADDVRWMLELLASRMLTRNAGRFRELGLDAACLARSERALTRALRGGNQLARTEVMAVLAKAGVDPGGQRGIHIIGNLAQRGVLCLATRIGKQASFALLEEWVPAGRPRSREAALTELGQRYFASHGPATVHDFAWWAGLTLGDARRAVAGAGLNEDDDGRFALPGAAPGRVGGAHFLPPWDEYIVAYKDRSQLLAAAHAARAPDLLRPTVLASGQLVATWTRVLTRAGVAIKLAPFGRATAAQQAAIAAAAARYGAFLEREATVVTG